MKLAKAVDRRSWLEDEFFRRVDDDLRNRLHERSLTEQRAESLRRATGIRDPRVLNELAALEFDAESLSALSMYPIVAVAWSDGCVDERERRAVLEGAAVAGCAPGSPAYTLLQTWLERKPSERLHTAWQAYLRGVSTAISREARSALKHSVLAQARLVAAASGDLLGLNAISKSEVAVLEQLAREFDDMVSTAA